MCGFTGVVWDQRAVSEKDRSMIIAMTETLRHRGPDDVNHDFSWAGFGHRRLSIIDIEGGLQPMWDDTKQVCIAFNGEIYNYRELRAEMVTQGCAFRTNSDTEVLLQSYLIHGKACVDHLNGMFAFAIWDQRTKEMFLARDRLGEKPLYYAQIDGGLIFGSELKALNKSNLYERNVDLDALATYFCVGYVPAPATIMRGVNKLQAGEWISWAGDKLTKHRYWSPDENSGPSEGHPTMAGLEELIRDAVTIRLRSDVPVGAFLSGGIDSSLISAYARDAYGSALQTFCIKFDDKKADESKFAAEVARLLGTQHNEITVDDLNIGILPELVDQFDEPFADPSALPTYYVTQAASQHLKVCLSGDGGDEMFGGYSRYAPEPMESWVENIPSALRRGIYRATYANLPHSTRGKGWARRMSSSSTERFLQKIWLFTDDELAYLLRPEWRSLNLGRSEFRAKAKTLQNERDDWQMLFDQQTYLPEDILVKTDRTSMKNSLEVRVPLLDHRIAELANSAPRDWKLAAGELKAPLKFLARQRFPAHLTDRPKHGFSLPLLQWFKSGPLAEQFGDLVLSAHSKVGRYVRIERIEALRKAHIANQRDFGRKLWSLLWLELWMRQNDL